MDDQKKPDPEESSSIGGGGPAMTEADIDEKDDPTGLPSDEHGEEKDRDEDRPHLGSAGSGGEVDEDPGAGAD
jgi:hypothetical protein